MDFERAKKLLDKKIPNHIGREYHFGRRIYSEGDVERIGSIYFKGSPDVDNSFLYMIEIFPEGELPDLGDKDREIEGLEIFEDYVPDFRFAERLSEDTEKKIAWIEDNEVHSIILDKGEPGNGMDEFVKLIRDKATRSSDWRTIDSIDRLPEKSNNWELKTIILWQRMGDAPQRHVTEYIQGNYLNEENEEEWLNLEFRLGCGCSSEEVKENLVKLQRDPRIKEESSTELEGKKLKVRSLENFKGQSKARVLQYYEDSDNFSIIAHTNDSIGDNDYQEDLKDLIEAGINSMEDYSLIERLSDVVSSGALDST